MSMLKKIFKNGTHKFTLSEEIKPLLSAKEIFILEQIGIPKRILYTDIICSEVYVENNAIVFGISNSFPTKYGIELTSRNVFSYSINDYTEKLFINSNLESFVMSYFCLDFFVGKSIQSETLGAYYDKSPEGGNFEQYANLLEMLITDIDDRATKEGVWAFFIGEMKLGVI